MERYKRFFEEEKPRMPKDFKGHYNIICSSCGKRLQRCRCSGEKSTFYDLCVVCGGVDPLADLRSDII